MLKVTFEREKLKVYPTVFCFSSCKKPEVNEILMSSLHCRAGRSCVIPVVPRPVHWSVCLPSGDFGMLCDLIAEGCFLSLLGN